MNRIIKKYSLIILTIIMCFTFNNCNQEKKVDKVQNPLNPTSYIFNKTLEEIRKNILDSLGSQYTLDPNEWGDVTPEGLDFTLSTVLVVETSKDGSPFSKDIFSDSLFSDDIYLHSFGTPVSLSSYYSKDGKPLKYIATFQIHFKEITGSNKTEISIITRDSKVITGLTSGFLNPHGPANIYKDVEPTTIEEYRLLKVIGKIIGEKNMPEIKY